MSDIKSNINRGKALTQKTTFLEIPDKGRTIKGMVAFNSSDLEPLDLQKGLALDCYKPSSEV